MSEWFVKFRKAHGLTQTDLAKMLGCSQQLVSRIEKGHQIKIKSAKKFAEVLNIDWKKFY